MLFQRPVSVEVSDPLLARKVCCSIPNWIDLSNHCTHSNLHICLQPLVARNQYQENSFTSLLVHHKIDVTKSLLAQNQSNYVENIPISVFIFKHVFMLHFQYSHLSTSVCTRTNHYFSRAKLNNFVLNGSKASQIQTKNGKFQSKSLPSKQKKQILTNYHPQKSRESLVKISDFFDFRQKFV